MESPHLFIAVILQWAVAYPGMLGVVWTLAVVVALKVMPLGRERPLWVFLHPLALMYNPKDSRHVARPQWQESLVLLLASLFTGPLLIFGSVWVATAYLKKKFFGHSRLARKPPSV